MPEKALPFAVIQAMDDETLNLMIEAAVYGRTWTRYGTGEDPNGDRLYEGQHSNDGPCYTLSYDLAYTVHIDKAWSLLWRYGITLAHCRASGVWALTTDDGRLTVGASTEAQVRRRICELALWQAMQREVGAMPGDPTQPAQEDVYKDAARYQFLRDHAKGHDLHMDGTCYWQITGWGAVRAHTFEEAMDTARAREADVHPERSLTDKETP